MYCNEFARGQIEPGEEFDLIVVGSGNGACGFLSECLKYKSQDYKVLVLEQGQHYFETSNITHQFNWSKGYSTSSIYKLHDTVTTDCRSVLSGRATTMGGGGSLNYTMIHESSSWLADKMGRDPSYWDTLKSEINGKLNRPDPFEIETPFARYIQERALDQSFAQTKEQNYTKHIPNYIDADVDDYDTKEAKQLYIFPTQFDRFGNRIGSGVSIVDWDNVYLRCEREVTGLAMKESRCTGVQVKNLTTNQPETYLLKSNGRVVLASGSHSPRLLLRTPQLTNEKIGKRVNDHICMPLGIYVVSKENKAVVGPTDNYESLFGTSIVRFEDGTEPAVINLDFFSGEFDRLIYLVSSLYLCYLPFNGFKRFMGRYPFIFTILSNSLRILLTVLIFIARIVLGIGNVLTCKPWGSTSFKLTTSLIKFSSLREGYYEAGNGNRIILPFFEDEKDVQVAEDGIKTHLDLLGSIGSQPNFLIRAIFRFITKIPYKPSQVKRYVRNFAKRTLLSEQHLAGGCIFGDVIDKGLDDPSLTGRVIGSENIHVADLSAVPLPRVSTQMTAYLVGHHVGRQLYGHGTEKGSKGD
mmetsp:Transcript_22377/g.33824  ORF Transcript_22377/g.33824 Transcript_22377/m.33824 type:complete len:581 (+) Transcript_22377:247-1989(+)